MPEILTFADPEETHDAIAAFLLEGVKAFFEYVPEVHLAMTGGTDGTQTSLSLLRLLTAQPVEGRVHLWWSDERFVDYDDDLRNDKQISELVEEFRLGSFVECHRAPSPADSDIETAALRWEKEVSQIDFAFAVVGVGPDGHIASLFPGLWNINEPRSVFAVTDSPKPPAERLTFSFGTIRDAQNIAVIATGVSKAAAISGAIAGKNSLPITALAALEQCSLWLDDAAARSIPTSLETE